MALAIATQRRPHGQPRHVQSTPPERHLALVPVATRRTIRLFVAGVIGLFFLLAVSIGFQAVIAEQQLKIDHLSSEIRLAKQYEDVLRQQRAGLLAPEYLREQAGLQGMFQGLGSKFVEIPQDVVAQVAIATSQMDAKLADPSPMAIINPLAALANLQPSPVAP
ncbi:MAG: hypothetical protein D4R44_02485 [Actinobacteria bacterium]|nr:MAG: hypothetical protein D4R44_02485 [Actinomycetota bacterium]